MSIFNFEADLMVHDGGIDVKLVADAVGQSFRVARFEQNYIAADLRALELTGVPRATRLPSFRMARRSQRSASSIR